MPSVEIGSWPSFGHIFMRIAFSKIAKNPMKYKISTIFHVEFESYEKVLAKWPNDVKKKSFWPKYVPLAKGCLHTISKFTLAKFWPIICLRKSHKIEK